MERGKLIERVDNRRNGVSSFPHRLANGIGSSSTEAVKSVFEANEVAVGAILSASPLDGGAVRSLRLYARTHLYDKGAETVTPPRSVRKNSYRSFVY